MTATCTPGLPRVVSGLVSSRALPAFGPLSRRIVTLGIGGGVATGRGIMICVMQELGINPAKVNPLGGAIALGHPLGATGAIRIATVTHGLQRTGGKYGMVTMCIGTGMGAAGIIERI